MSTLEVIGSLDVAEFKAVVESLDQRILIVKFGAPWCRPCRRIGPACATRFAQLPPNVLIADLDIEETLDLYSALSTKKMVRGVPAILCYGGADRDTHAWYAPDDSYSGEDMTDLHAFFDRCGARATKLLQPVRSSLRR